MKAMLQAAASLRAMLVETTVIFCSILLELQFSHRGIQKFKIYRGLVVDLHSNVDSMTCYQCTRLRAVLRGVANNSCSESSHWSYMVLIDSAKVPTTANFVLVYLWSGSHS